MQTAFLWLACLGSLCVAAAVPFTAGSPAHAQAHPRFEVATIRQSQALQPGRVSFPSPGRVSVTDFTLQALIGFAYRGGGANVEITGGPDWINRARYTVLAQAESSRSAAELRLMMQTLLAERFALKFHTEQKGVDVYALVLAKSDGTLGPNVHPFEGDCTAGVGGTCPAMASPATGLQLTGQPMAMLATMLSAPMTALGRQVVDRTGLSGRFNMTLEFQFAPPGVNAGASSATPSLFTVLQEQLGVKLEPSRGTVTVLVVDQAERPTEN